MTDMFFYLVWEHMLLQLCTAGPLLLPPIQGKGPAVQTTAEKSEKRNLTHMFSRYVLQMIENRGRSQLYDHRNWLRTCLLLFF